MTNYHKLSGLSDTIYRLPVSEVQESGQGLPGSSTQGLRGHNNAVSGLGSHLETRPERNLLLSSLELLAKFIS